MTTAITVRLRCLTCNQATYVTTQTRRGAAQSTWLDQHRGHRFDDATGRLAQLRFGCLTKTVYASRRAARRRAEAVYARKGVELSVYACDQGPHFHVARKPVRPEVAPTTSGPLGAAVEQHGSICVECSAAWATVAMRASNGRVLLCRGCASTRCGSCREDVKIALVPTDMYVWYRTEREGSP